MQLLLLAAIVWFAFTTEAATGFGSTLITLALGMRLYPLHQLLPMIVPLNLMLQSYIVARHRKHVAGALVLRRIMPWMTLGVAIGFAVFQYVSSDVLKRIFGFFVLAVAARETVRVLRGGAGRHVHAVSHGRQALGICAAGITHGMFACGGPLLVYVLGRSDLNKRRFRSTLAAVWLVFNTILIVGFALSRRLDATIVPALAVLVPAVLVSIVTGEWVHRRLNERHFRLAVSILLIVAGISIAF